MQFLVEDKITNQDLKAVMNYVNKVFNRIGLVARFSTHFIDRVNDTRNSKPITPQELAYLLKQTAIKYGKEIERYTPETEAVIKGMRNDINMPFVIKKRRDDNRYHFLVKTIIRKKNFGTSNRIFRIEQLGFKDFRNLNRQIQENAMKTFDEFNRTEKPITEKVDREEASRIDSHLAEREEVIHIVLETCISSLKDVNQGAEADIDEYSQYDKGYVKKALKSTSGMKDHMSDLKEIKRLITSLDF